MHFLNVLSNTISLKVLLILVLLDTIFGTLRSIRQRKLNSTIGIDGLIRKFGMIISVICFIGIDLLVKFNFIGFVPEELRLTIGITNVGFSSLFAILYIIYELLSIIKNMIICKLPIPKKLQEALERIFKTYTSELDDEKGVKNNGKIKRN